MCIHVLTVAAIEPMVESYEKIASEDVETNFQLPIAILIMVSISKAFTTS